MNNNPGVPQAPDYVNKEPIPVSETAPPVSETPVILPVSVAEPVIPVSEAPVTPPIPVTLRVSPEINLSGVAPVDTSVEPTPAKIRQIADIIAKDPETMDAFDRFSDELYSK